MAHALRVAKGFAFSSMLYLSAALSAGAQNPPAAVDDPTQDFAKTLGMGAQQRLEGQLATALTIQERREAVPKDLKDYYEFLQRNPLLQYLRSNPDVELFHVLLWNQFALDMTSLDHTTKGDKDPTDPTGMKLLIEDLYAEQLGPARSSRAMAIAHLAMFEAANTIVNRYQSYKPPGAASDIRTQIVASVGVSDAELRGASLPTAIAYSAYSALSKLYPAKQAVLDADIEQTLILIKLTQQTTATAELAKKIGRAAADAVLMARANDNSQAPGINSKPCGTPPKHSTCLEPQFASLTPDPSKPFVWQPDPVLPIATQLGGTWPNVTPFVTTKDQFIGTNGSGGKYLVVGAGGRTTSPSETDADFLQSLNDGGYGGTRPDPRLGSTGAMLFNKYGVRQYGRNLGSPRNNDLTARGIYWGYDGTALLCAPPRLYNMIATSVALGRKNPRCANCRGHDALLSFD